jgi:Ring finger domain
MELSEQLGVVPRGLSDAAFGALRTAVFKDLEPGLGPLSPTLSTVSQSELSTSDLPAVSPTLASFSSPRIRRARTGKWVAQCSICLEEYRSEDICVTLDCTHFFHQPCVRVSILPLQLLSYTDDAQ